MHDFRGLVALLGASRIVGTLPPAIAGIVLDSRLVRTGSLFVALAGERSDGHDFAPAAIAAGARLLVVERELDVGVPQIVVPDTRVALSRLAAAYYGNPSQNMTVVGVTGTNGKTTTTHLVCAILEAAGIACGTIGTLGAAFRDRTWPLENTTPLALDLHRVLAEMRGAGARAVAMEVSSHALALDRVEDVAFDVAALTNITRDHLDFHRTFERYVEAKRHLFDLAPRAVLNLDDPTGRDLALAHANAQTYAIDAEAALRARNICSTPHGSTFEVAGMHVEIRLPGRFNVSNALAAIGVARALHIAERAIVGGLAALAGVPGRMQHFTGEGIEAIVDYAHTPDALAAVLGAMRERTRGRLIVVFGCGGDRDTGKREEMGRIAAALADRAIVTSDNPRSEDPVAIAREVAGATDAEIELDRRTAIRRAIADAVAGDAVVVAGKGHERDQIVGPLRLPFDDAAEVRDALAARSGAVVHP